jgi:Pectate lyase superfamily protein
MAIVQISQITNRLGLNVDLPQLAGAELGWSTDTRQLFIGNGTLAQGAPVIGNTEVLTEFSDILNLAASYTYKGTAAGYTVQTGPTPGTPVTLSLQNWLDQFASVLDFGAKGDGLTDDTAAINRALNQLYCIQSNPQVRRSLFFPAGVYVVSGPINIPSYATLYGEGPDNSIIQMIVSGGTGTCVAQTADSLQQTGVNIGNGGATPPTDINVSNMAFLSLDSTKNIFLVESSANSKFSSVGFYGAGTMTTLTSSSANTSGVLLASIAATTTDVIFDSCKFSGTTYGINTSDVTKGIVVTNSNFNTLYQGVALGTGSIVSDGPSGTRITTNVFDNIYSTGIIIGMISLNISGYNIFYGVANHFLDTSNPQGSVIIIEGNNNASIGDMFERSDLYSVQYPRISLGSSVSIATTNGSQIQLGSKTVQSGATTNLLANSYGTAFTIDTSTGVLSFKVDYSIVQNSTLFRTGTLFVATASSPTIVPITGATGNGTVATLSFASTSPFNVSSTIAVDSIIPSGYNGTFVVVDNPLPSGISVSYASSITDAYTSGGQIVQYVPNYTDDYVENANLAILLSVVQLGQSISVQYISTANTASQMSYSISYFN